MIRLFVLVVIAISLTVCGATVKLGKRTFFGHVRAIWATEEVQDAKEGIEEKAGPVVDDLKKKAGPTVDKMGRAGKKALDEMARDDDNADGKGTGKSGKKAEPGAEPTGPASSKW